ncbi:MAG: hypothetical protein FWD53_09990, partial [Phycisphaerales bacterium]|nr:hypothetical protein [Phycisphaerales bacterium]
AYRSGGVQKGTIGGQTINIYNENTDGVYSITDSYRMDNGPTASMFFAPLSKYIATKAGIFEITDIAEDGSSISYTPYTDKTGKFAWAPMLDPSVEVHAFYKSKTSDLNIALTARSSIAETTAIPGDYELQRGMVYSPKIKKRIATITPQSGGTLTVNEGATTKADWGKPFTLEFTATKSGGKINVPPSFKIRGKAGETYGNFITAAYESSPEVFLLVDNKPTSLGRMGFT